MAAVGKPSETILIGEKHDSDNLPGVGPRSLFYSRDIYNTYWGNGSIPEGTRDPKAAYPNGPSGSVSDRHTGTANFTFADGHAKAMRPAATNPLNTYDADTSKNMWDATRQ